MSEALSQAGSLGYMVMLGAVVGVLACAALAGLAFTRRRVPLIALLIIPYALLAVGAFGGWVGTALVPSQVEVAEPGMIPIVAMNGVWQAMSVDWLARWAAALVLMAGAWAAAVGSFAVPGPEPKFTLVSAGAAAGVALVGAIGLAIYAARSGIGGQGYALAGVVFVSGAGVALGATRRAADDEMFRVAGMRFASSMCMLLGIFHAVRAVDVGNRITAFSSDSPLMMATDLTKAIALYATMVDPGVTIGVTAMLIAFVLAFFGFFAEIGEVVVRYTMFDMFAVVAVMVMVGGLRLVESLGFNAGYAVGVNFPAVEMYAEMGVDMPVGTMLSGELAIPVRFVEGGFGDVLAFEREEWVRTFKWTGRTWVEDHTPLATATLSSQPPLLAVPRGLPAETLLEVLDKTDKAYLMLRGSQVKAGVYVPAEFGRLQTTFLPITKRPRDLKTELWLEAGAPEVNLGPIVWFGEKDDSLDPLEYSAAALTATSGTGIHILTGPRKVSDVVLTCMGYIIDRTGTETEPVLTYNKDRWCAIAGDELEVVREEAAAVTELPQPANVRLSIDLEGSLDPAEVNTIARRELGAIGFCAEQAVLAGEVLTGRMTIHLPVSKEGDVYDTLVDEKSKLQSPAILACVKRRFRRASFTLPEPVEPPPVPEGRKPPEPPPVPKATLHFDF